MTSDTAEFDDQPLGDIAERIAPGGRLVRAWPLTGGVSAAVMAIEIETAARARERFVVRRHGAIDRARNLGIARDEFQLLETVRRHGVKAPRAVMVRAAGDPFPEPALVVEFIDGETVFEPGNVEAYLTRAARELAAIHRVEDGADVGFLPRREPGFGERPVAMDAAMGEERIREALEAAGPAPVGRPVLLHGDVWPGNLLWRDEELMATIDWEDAAVGDQLDDLGNSRLEMLWAFGEAAMELFTRAYLAETGIDTGALWYWDLRAALRPCGKLGEWGLEPGDERRMRERHGWFVERALGAR